MLKPSELRIGNYFQDDENEICQMKYLRPNIHDAWSIFHTLVNRTDIPLGRVGINYASPILFTEQWAEKLGFHLIEEITHDFTEKIYGISLIKGQPNHEEQLIISLPFGCIHIGAYRLDEAYALNIGINHVHKIQNLFHSLAGWELTIKS